MDVHRGIAERVGGQDGFGLVELLIAMTIMVVGIMAVVAAFSAGALSLQRASRTSTAGTVADARMEKYRALTYSKIALTTPLQLPPDTLYTTHSAYSDPTQSASQVTDATLVCAAATPTPCAIQMVTGADGRLYRVDAYVKTTCPASQTPPPCGATEREVKVVTLVVRDGTTASKILFRESSTFDAALG
jgi:Tfp pilus assembly protein PilV